MKISFVAGFAPIVRDTAESVALYHEALGVPLDDPQADYPMTDRLPGVKHFGVWNLRDCAEACFGTAEWPAKRPVPQGSFEVDVASEAAVAEAARELEAQGYALLHPVRTEPWGQTLTRLQSPDGLIIGVAYTPQMHEGAAQG